MAIHCSILAWEIPWTRGAWRATVHDIARVGHDWAHMYIIIHPLPLMPEKAFETTNLTFSSHQRSSPSPWSIQVQCLSLSGSRWLSDLTISVFLQIPNACPASFYISIFYVSLSTCVSVAAFALKKAISFFCLMLPLLPGSNPKESSPPLFFFLLLSTNSLSIPVFL